MKCDAISFDGEHELQGSPPRNSFEQIASDKYDKGYIEMCAGPAIQLQLCIRLKTSGRRRLTLQ